MPIAAWFTALVPLKQYLAAEMSVTSLLFVSQKTLLPPSGNSLYSQRWTVLCSNLETLWECWTEPSFWWLWWSDLIWWYQNQMIWSSRDIDPTKFHSDEFLIDLLRTDLQDLHACFAFTTKITICSINYMMSACIVATLRNAVVGIWIILHIAVISANEAF